MTHEQHTYALPLRVLRSMVRILVLLMALVAAGVLPIGTGTAHALVGTAGPVTVTVTTAPGTDPLQISFHAEVSGGPVIYGLTAHLCVPGAVRNTYDFGYQSGFCPNVAVGKGDIQKVVPVPGATSADLNGFKVGSGTADWLDENGFPHTLTCDVTSKCEVVVKINYTGQVVFFHAPICYSAATCQTDNVPAPAPTSAPSSAPGKPGVAAAAAAGATNGGSGSGSGTGHGGGTTGSGSSSGSGSPTASGSAAKPPPGANANSTSTGRTAEEVALAGRTASVVSVPTGGLSRSVRVLLAALTGALCGARILYVFSKVRRQAASGMVAS